MKVAESVVVFAILWIISAQAAEFVEEPSSVNVTEGTTAIFNCTAYSLGFHWLINDEIIEHPDNIHRGIQKLDTTIDDETNLKIHLLIIPGIAKNKDLTITCYVYDFTTISSNPAKLLVQGLLDEVKDINITQLNTTSIEVSFTPPNTLIGIPITNYSIDVLSDEEDPVITYWILHENIIIHLNDSCVNYTLEIAAWNEVGRGDTEMISVILHQVPLEPPTTPNSEIQFISDSPHVVLYTTISSSCVGRIPDNITILLDTINAFTNTPIATCHHMYSCNDSRFTLTNADDTVWMLSVNISSSFLPGRHYRAQFVFRNKAGITHSSVINISTFQTRLANIDYVNDIVCVDCYFTEGSTSGGCLAVFVDNNNQLSNQTVFAPRSKTVNNYARNCDSSLSAGSYTVFIYDSSYGEIESGVVLYINTVINESSTQGTTTQAITTLAITTQTTTLQTTSTTTDPLLDPTTSVTVTETVEDVTNPLPILLIVLCVSGGTLALLIILILLLMFCLIRYKKKNRSLKIAEIDARQNQRNAENVLYALTWTSGSEQIYSPDPVYENMDEVQLGVTNPNTVSMQNCPAYVTLPNAIKK